MNIHSWEHWVPLWLNDKAPSTQKIYGDEIKSFLSFVTSPPAELRAIYLEQYRRYLLDRAESPHTTNRKISTVRSLISFINKHNPDVMPQNIGAPIRMLTAPDDLAEKVLSEPELLRMFAAAARSPRNLALLRVLYNSGTRISEALNLRWSDIVWREHDALLNVQGKGGKPRTIAIYDAARNALEALQTTSDAKPSDHVFRTCHGPLTRIYAVQVVRRIARRAGIDKAVAPVWLRHTSATHALDRNAPVMLIKETLGHASLATTGRYLRIRPGESMGKFHAV